MLWLGGALGCFIRSLDRGRVSSPSVSWWLPPETGSHSQDYCLRKVGSFKMESGPGKKTLRLRWGRGLREWGLCFLTDPPEDKQDLGAFGGGLAEVGLHILAWGSLVASQFFQALCFCSCCLSSGFSNTIWYIFPGFLAVLL